MAPIELLLLLVSQAPSDSPAPAAAVPVVTDVEPVANLGFLHIVTQADPVVQGTMLLLAVFSLLSWAIIVQKWQGLGKATRNSAKFLEFFWHSKHLADVYQALPQFNQAPVAQVFKAGYVELEKVNERKNSSTPNPHQLRGAEIVGRSLRRATNAEITELERMTSFLATIGSASPFIGLFGTVWGIMRAFQEIGQSQSTSIATVGPYISEALIATAIGLFAAIPAVMFYNYFISRIRVLSAEMDNFSSDLLNIVERHLSS